MSNCLEELKIEENIKKDINSFYYKKLIDLIKIFDSKKNKLKKENRGDEVKKLKQEIESIKNEINRNLNELKNDKLKNCLKKFQEENFKDNLISFHKRYIFKILDFSDENLKFLLNGGAFVVAKTFEFENTITSTQFRRFYEYVLKAIQRNDEKAFFQLSAFVAYAKNRKKAKEFFYDLMEESLTKIEQIKEKDKEDKYKLNFKLFLESILGFMPKK